MRPKSCAYSGQDRPRAVSDRPVLGGCLLSRIKASNRDGRAKIRYCDAFAFGSDCRQATWSFPMGQIIRLPVAPAGYPETSADLDPAECVLLVAIRWWVDAWLHDDDPMPRLHQGLEAAGTRDAAFSIDALMRIVARTVRQPITFYCPRCPHLSGDEKRLPHTLRRPATRIWRKRRCAPRCSRGRVRNSRSVRWRASVSCSPRPGCFSAGGGNLPKITLRLNRGFRPCHREWSIDR